MIYLFTAIPPERPYYKRDLLNICCHQINIDMQFSYRELWVEKKLRKNIKKELENKDAMIVYCEFDRLKSPPDYKYHPVRLVNILKVLPEGELTTIFFRLGAFFDYKKFRANISNVIQEFRQFINRMENKPVPQDDNVTKYFVQKNIDWHKEYFSIDDSTWIGLLNYMREREYLKDSTLFKIEKFSKVKNLKKAKLKDLIPLNYLNNKPTYKLRSGNNYQFTFQVLPRIEGSFKLPKINMSEVIASIIGPFFIQEAPELKVDYVIHCKKSFRTEPSTLSIFVPSDDEEDVQSPIFNFMAHVFPPRWHIMSIFILVLLGSFLISLGPDYLKSIGSLVSCSIEKFLRENIAFISSVSKGLGASFLAIASWLALRKLPTKLG